MSVVAAAAAAAGGTAALAVVAATVDPRLRAPLLSTVSQPSPLAPPSFQCLSTQYRHTGLGPLHSPADVPSVAIPAGRHPRAVKAAAAARDTTGRVAAAASSHPS